MYVVSKRTSSCYCQCHHTLVIAIEKPNRACGAARVYLDDGLEIAIDAAIGRFYRRKTSSVLTHTCSPLRFNDIAGSDGAATSLSSRCQLMFRRGRGEI